MTHAPRLPLGIKVIIGFHLFSFVIWLIGQTGAVIAYDTSAKLGLQDPRSLLDPVIVEVNRGIGLADTIIMLPLFIRLVRAEMMEVLETEYIKFAWPKGFTVSGYGTFMPLKTPCCR